jgi:hypothetical protein
MARMSAVSKRVTGAAVVDNDAAGVQNAGAGVAPCMCVRFVPAAAWLVSSVEAAAAGEAAVALGRDALSTLGRAE